MTVPKDKTTMQTAGLQVGISSIGLAIPPLALPVTELARVRGEAPEKYTLGLGCDEMSLCPPGYGVVDMACEAATRALAHWDQPRSRIGLLAVGTESAIDMSRPLSAWVADHLGLAGPIRSYEVKHACYGGTLALRQAVEWRIAQAAGGGAQSPAALVVAVDEALYATGDPGEPTQGAGAVAMIVDDGRIATIEGRSHAWSEPAFDFWRPLGEDYPRVDGPFSLECYKRAVVKCFASLVDLEGESVVEELAAACFHVPFPKMVKKAVLHLGEHLGWSLERTTSFFLDRVEPTMEWNRKCGNAYTASLWISVARALAGATRGDRLVAFSYGSGFGAELLKMTAGDGVADAPWATELRGDLERREMIDADSYCRLRGEASHPIASAM